MRKILLALLIAISCFGVVHADPIPNDGKGNVPVTLQSLPCLNGTIQNAQINVSAGSTAQVVGLVAGEQIHVCSYWFFSNGSGTVQIEYGTGTSCGTGTTPLSGAAPFTAETGIAMPFTMNQYFNIPAGNAFCIATTSSATAQGEITYTVF